MKKFTAMLLIVVLALSVLASCGGVDHSKKSEGVMTYEEYTKAEIGDEVVIEAYVQATQSWWFDSKANHGKITAYLADLDGGYFGYEMKCTEEEAAKLVKGAKIKLTGYKAEWNGEIEIIDGTFEVLDFEHLVMSAEDVTAILANEEELIKRQNKLVAIKGATVKSAAIYNWDGTGSEGSDLYITVTVDDADYTLVVESYLHGKDSQIYKDVKALKAGDKVDFEAFLYWYNGAQPHINSVAKK